MYLTKNELEIMDVLWSAGRPLSRGEILSFSEEKSWMDSSVHILLNSMLKKQAIREAGFVKCGKTCGRVYAPGVTCEEYYASTLDATRTVPELPLLLEAIIAKKGTSVKEILAMERILKAKKAELKAEKD